MYLGRVVGCVWSTVKHPDLEGQRLLMVQPLTPELKNTGKTRLICTDCDRRRRRRTGLLVPRQGIQLSLSAREVPTDTTIVGIVDSRPREAGPERC